MCNAQRGVYSFHLLPSPSSPHLPPLPPHTHTCTHTHIHTHQVYRLQGQVDLALADLDRAIQLSGGRGRAAEQAYTQRGLVWRLREEDERALEDFKSAARLGGHFAQKQVGLFVW